MKRMIFSLLLVGWASLPASAQTVAPSLNDAALSAKIDELVAIAWRRHPDYSLSESEIETATLNLKRSRLELLNKITLQGNLNEFTVNDLLGTESANDNLFFPRYNIGLGFSVGSLFEQPKERKILREQIEVAETNRVARRRALRQEIIVRYLDFLMFEEVFKRQSENTSNEQSKLAALEELFEQGDATLEAYEEGLRLYNSERLKEIKAERDYQVARLALETLLGQSVTTID